MRSGTYAVLVSRSSASLMVVQILVFLFTAAAIGSLYKRGATVR
jgi:hypothetical protein